MPAPPPALVLTEAPARRSAAVLTKAFERKRSVLRSAEAVAAANGKGAARLGAPPASKRRKRTHQRRPRPRSPDSKRSCDSVEIVGSSLPAGRGQAAAPPPRGSPSPRDRAASVENSSRPVVLAPSFHDALLFRIRDLCGEHEDAKVLAEYIAVMVEGNIDKAVMAEELLPFVRSKSKAADFVVWIEALKRKHNVPGHAAAGGEPTAGRREAGIPAARSSSSSGSTDSDSSQGAPNGSTLRPPAVLGPGQSRPAAAGTPRAQGPEGTFSYVAPAAQGSPLKGPHVAVTSRVVLQPSPDFNAGNVTLVQATGPPPGNWLGQEKHQLLERMTHQLQLILTRLGDESLSSEARKKCQAMAATLQAQITSVSKPAPGYTGW